MKIENQAVRERLKNSLNKERAAYQAKVMNLQKSAQRVDAMITKLSGVKGITSDDFFFSEYSRDKAYLSLKGNGTKAEFSAIIKDISKALGEMPDTDVTSSNYSSIPHSSYTADFKESGLHVWMRDPIESCNMIEVDGEQKIETTVKCKKLVSSSGLQSRTERTGGLMTEGTTQHEEWLKSLKKGDIACIPGGFSKGDYTTVTVLRKTPGGKIVVSYINADVEVTFDKYGRHRAGRFNTTHLMPITEEMKESRRRNKRLSAIADFSFKTATDEQVKQVYDLLQTFVKGKPVDETGKG